LVSGRFLSSVEVDTHNGQIYVAEYTDNPILFELDNAIV